jgi:hypothetical protein
MSTLTVPDIAPSVGGRSRDILGWWWNRVRRWSLLEAGS